MLSKAGGTRVSEFEFFVVFVIYHLLIVRAFELKEKKIVNDFIGREIDL